MSEQAPWQSNVELRALNTFGVASMARRFVRATDPQGVRQAVADCRDRGEAPLILGGGSNLLIVGDLDMPVIQPDLRGIALTVLDEDTAELEAAAAEPWDEVVSCACAQGLWGIENLALIPGTAGAAPIQNIGAYGVELKDTLSWVDALHLQTDQIERLDAGRLQLGYRDSCFKRVPGQWLVMRIGLRLRRTPAPKLEYAGLRDAFGQAVPRSPALVADAVRSIRRRKLPDPRVTGNAGSFFKNPEIDSEAAEALGARLPGLPIHLGSHASLRKLSAAWLIEQAGFKGYRVGDAGVSEHHALVLVNHGDASGADLLALAREVAAGVEQRFGVSLEPEPVVLGASFRAAA